MENRYEYTFIKEVFFDENLETLLNSYGKDGWDPSNVTVNQDRPPYNGSFSVNFLMERPCLESERETCEFKVLLDVPENRFIDVLNGYALNDGWRMDMLTHPGRPAYKNGVCLSATLRRVK